MCFRYKFHQRPPKSTPVEMLLNTHINQNSEKYDGKALSKKNSKPIPLDMCVVNLKIKPEIFLAYRKIFTNILKKNYFHFI